MLCIFTNATHVCLPCPMPHTAMLLFSSLLPSPAKSKRSTPQQGQWQRKCSPPLGLWLPLVGSRRRQRGESERDIRVHLLSHSNHLQSLWCDRNHYLCQCCVWFSPLRYDSKLKEARLLGAKKGFTLGISLFVIFFLLFLVNAAAFW